MMIEPSTSRSKSMRRGPQRVIGRSRPSFSSRRLSSTNIACGDSRVSTWLYRTTTRLAIDHLRRERIKRRLFFFRQDNDAPDPVELAGDTRPDPGRAFQSQEAMRLLRKSLGRLSPRQRVIFTLRHYEGLPLKEIAEHLALETGTVKAHLHRAVTQLRQDLADYHEE